MVLFDQLTDQQRTDLLIAADFAEEAHLQDVCELLRSVASSDWLPLLPLNAIHGSPLRVLVEGHRRTVDLHEQEDDRLLLLSYPASGQTVGLFDQAEGELLLRSLGKLDSDFEVIDTVRWLYHARLNLTPDRVVRVTCKGQPLGTFATTSIKEERHFSAVEFESWTNDGIELRRCDPAS